MYLKLQRRQVFLVAQPIECGMNLPRVAVKSFLGSKSSKQDNRGRPPILIEEYTQFLIKCVDSNAVSTVDLAIDELCKAFLDLRISVNAVYKHMRTKYNLTLKRAEILRKERDSDTTIRKRKLYIEKCKENNADYQKNCVFIDEAGFNLHSMRNRA